MIVMSQVPEYSMNPQTTADTQHNGPISPSSPSSHGATVGRTQISGGRFDFEDGGTYCGGWEEGKAHGYGVCTGPKHQGAYSGAWNYGFEVSGVYIWPSGSAFEGQWQNGRRHGLGVETRGRWLYRGEWTSGSKGRYGVRQSASSTAKYEGTWAGGLQDGYGSETYADGGSYQGQWQEGKRHGYGVRQSAPFGHASHYRPKNIHTSMSSLRSNDGGNHDPAEKRNHRMDEIRGGFVLKARSDEPPARRNSLVEKPRKGLLSTLKLKKQHSTGDLEKRGTGASGSIRSTVSTASWISTASSQSGMTNKSVHTDSNASFTVEEEQLDPNVTEVYKGEWKRDKRDGYGISERSDGLKYEGEWHNNKKHGYGVTTFRDGTKEEGKYKYNVLITSQKKKHLFLIRSAKFRERIEAAVNSSQRASKYALQKADIAVSRMATARGKAEQADRIADTARVDSELAVATAREFAPDFKPSVLERFERIKLRERFRSPTDTDLQVPSKTITASTNRLTGPGQQPVTNQANASSYQQQMKPNTGMTTQNQMMQQHQTQAQQPPTNTSLPQQPLPNMNQMQPSNQTQFSANASIRRSSLLKQSSFDYASETPRNTAMFTKQNTINSGYSITNYAQQQTTQQNLTQQQSTSYQYAQQQPPGMSRFNNQQNSYQTNQQQSPNSMQSNIMSQQYGMENVNSSTAMDMNTNIYGSNYTNAGHSSTMPQNQPPPQQQSLYNQGGNAMYGGDSYGIQQQQRDNLYGQRQSQDYGMPSGAEHQNSMHASQHGRPMLGSFQQQSSIDHFDHYKRPPSRDSSTDRYARATSRMGGGFGSRQPSVERTGLAGNTTPDIPDRSARAGSAFRSMTPASGANSPLPATTGNGTVPTGTGAAMSRSGTPVYQQQQQPQTQLKSQPIFSSPNQPFEDVLLRQRTLGQDIIPSLREPKRTESLYLPPKPVPSGFAAGGGKGKLKNVPISIPLSRKKSLPDVQELPRATDAMSREEVSALGSARREEVRRQIENNERLKANPLLYLVSPPVKDWFSRQQLVLLVLVVNIAMAIMFYKMLT